jgi:hypothetical protein
MERTGDSRLALIAVVGLAVIGVLLIFLFPGSPEQDVDYHFLMARTAWVEPFYFVDVWARPLFTTLFAPVAFLGFVPARWLALVVSVAAAWETYRLADDLRVPRAWLVIPFLLGQETFFELFSNLFTEPLFALVLVVAVRCHIRGRIKSGMLVGSLLPLARPEGVFVCLFWGVSVAVDAWRLAGVGHRAVVDWRLIRRLGSVVILVSGVVIWWFAASFLTGDPLFILHNWPATWHTDMYGHGTFFSYAQRSREFVGVILIVPFLVGLVRGFRSRSWILITSVFLVLFLLHSVFVKYGLFGEAGFPRYMVSVAPAIALLTLEGWNTIFSVRILRRFGTIVGWVVVTYSILQSVHYLDGMIWARDAVAIDKIDREWIQPPQGLRGDGPRMDANKGSGQEQRYASLPGLIWSNGRMCIDLGRNLKDSPPVTSREKLDDLLEKAPTGTLVFWDSDIGPSWFGTTSAEIEGRGYTLLVSRNYSLPALIFPLGRFPWIDWVFPGLPAREIGLSLLQKTTTNSDRE